MLIKNVRPLVLLDKLLIVLLQPLMLAEQQEMLV
jgi:hypothetical protein